MTARRFLGWFLGVLGALLLAVMLYIAFGDLGRHKDRIEAMVTRSIGRPFAIEGPFTLNVIPVVAVSAERVRLGNMQGGSQPQMIEFGKAVVQIGFWSLISGPPDVRLFELHDATVLLERGSDGKGNWVMEALQAEEEPDADDEADSEVESEEAGALEVPVVIRHAQLNNVRLVYREAKKRDRVVHLEKLSITPGQEGLLALEGHGKLDVYPLVLKGEAGPLKSLLSARDMRIGMHGSLGKLVLDIKGTVGSLDPLDGADLTLRVEHPELGDMLRKLDFPVIASGTARIDGRLKDAGDLTHLDFNAKVGDLTASTGGTIKTLSLVGGDLTLKVEHTEIGAVLKALDIPVIATGPARIDAHIKDVGKHRQLDFKSKLGEIEATVKGTLKTRGLAGSDLEFEATAADAARLANAFGISGVPASPLEVSGHTVSSRKRIKFEAVTAAMAGASVRIDGTWQNTRDRKAALRFAMNADNLAKLRGTWPQIKVSASGAVELAKGRIEAKDLQAAVGENQMAGSFQLTEARVMEAQLTSPRLDLTPFFPQDKQAETDSSTAQRTAAPEKPEPPEKKFVFSEDLLPFDKMKNIDAKLHLAVGEVVLGGRSIKNLDGNVRLDHGTISVDLDAAGAHEGTLRSAGSLRPAADGTANLEIKIDITGWRSNLGNQDIAGTDVPPVALAIDLRIHGGSLRQMASGANGHVLLTQGAGKTKSGLISAYGGGVVTQLAQKLNPFAKDDPFMQLDCTIVRADIVNGEVTVKPVVIQTEKVTISAEGNIDLRTEKLMVDFNTRPRKGIGVSPGMFTNPLIRLEGTLISPKIGVGVKGLASGAMAAATGGATVVAGGLVDRMKGEQDICKTTLAAATDVAAH